MRFPEHAAQKRRHHLCPPAERVFVFGQVRTPGAYPIQKGTTVLQALALAGGLAEQGSTSRLKLVRTIDDKQVSIKVKLTDIVHGGDTIVVPRGSSDAVGSLSIGLSSVLPSDRGAKRESRPPRDRADASIQCSRVLRRIGA